MYLAEKRLFINNKRSIQLKSLVVLEDTWMRVVGRGGDRGGQYMVKFQRVIPGAGHEKIAFTRASINC